MRGCSTAGAAGKDDALDKALDDAPDKALVATDDASERALAPRLGRHPLPPFLRPIAWWRQQRMWPVGVVSVRSDAASLDETLA